MFPQEIFAAASPVEIFLKVSASATLPPSVIHILSNSYIHKSKGGLSGMVAVKHKEDLFTCSVVYSIWSEGRYCANPSVPLVLGMIVTCVESSLSHDSHMRSHDSHTRSHDSHMRSHDSHMRSQPHEVT